MYRTIKEPCSACDGEGQSFHASGPLKDGNIPGTWTRCKVCHGTGGEERELTLEERVEILEEALLP